MDGNGELKMSSLKKRNSITTQKIPTLPEIKAAIPLECFKATLSESFYYVIKDFVIVAIMFLIGNWIFGCESQGFQIILLPIYWFFQGTMFFAVFVLGHDCNHGSFSCYTFLNDCIGTFLHTAVMTPYYPWKLSHRHHHNNTGNMDRDEIFYPIRERDNTNKSFAPLFGLGWAWFLYLWKGFGPRPLNHWIPTHRIFSKHILGCVLSLASVALWIGLLVQLERQWGLLYLVCLYFLPLFICACYIVVVTFLHHTDTDLPWYGDDVWENVRGKLSSVDRDYGFLHNVIHTIGTHQIHHLFPIIPHYRLKEATRHFQKSFPNLVHFNDQRILPEFWQMFYVYAKQCIVHDETKIHYYDKSVINSDKLLNG